ncbi:MAG: hypothetical protein IPK82_04870 [Polyangiaceae bacterium]|nr:hypothetical protein [Polyangiaceae bacterium]
MRNKSTHSTNARFVALLLAITALFAATGCYKFVPLPTDPQEAAKDVKGRTIRSATFQSHGYGIVQEMDVVEVKYPWILVEMAGPDGKVRKVPMDLRTMGDVEMRVTSKATVVTAILVPSLAVTAGIAAGVAAAIANGFGSMRFGY